MTLYDILNKVDFDKVFADILRHVPDAEDNRSKFLLAFESLRSLKPCKNARCVIEGSRKRLLGRWRS